MLGTVRSRSPTLCIALPSAVAASVPYSTTVVDSPVVAAVLVDRAARAPPTFATATRPAPDRRHTCNCRAAIGDCSHIRRRVQIVAHKRANRRQSLLPIPQSLPGWTQSEGRRLHRPMTVRSRGSLPLPSLTHAPVCLRRGSPRRVSERVVCMLRHRVGRLSGIAIGACVEDRRSGRVSHRVNPRNVVDVRDVSGHAHLAECAPRSPRRTCPLRGASPIWWQRDEDLRPRRPGGALGDVLADDLGWPESVRSPVATTHGDGPPARPIACDAQLVLCQLRSESRASATDRHVAGRSLLLLFAWRTHGMPGRPRRELIVPNSEPWRRYGRPGRAALGRTPGAV